MNLIKLLFKLYKTLKSVGDSGVLVIRLSKSDNKYRISRCTQRTDRLDLFGCKMDQLNKMTANSKSLNRKCSYLCNQ